MSTHAATPAIEQAMTVHAALTGVSTAYGRLLAEMAAEIVRAREAAAAAELRARQKEALLESEKSAAAAAAKTYAEQLAIFKDANALLREELAEAKSGLPK